MTNFLHTVIGVYVATGLLTILTIIATLLIHAGIRRLENAVVQHLPPEQAQHINEWLDVIDRLAEVAVHDANSRLVSVLKQQGRFTPETAADVKTAVIADVLKNLGPLQTVSAEAAESLVEAIGQAIEKHVEQQKRVTS